MNSFFIVFKRALVLLFSFLVILGNLTGESLADLYVSIGIPFHYTFTGKSSDGKTFSAYPISGRLYHVRLPNMFGFGLETYQMGLKNARYTEGDLRLSVTLYDAFYMFDLFNVNTIIGTGIGVTRFEGTNTDKHFNEGQALQLFVRMAYLFNESFDIHASYHIVSSELTAKTSDYKANLNGHLIAIGFGLHF